MTDTQDAEFWRKVAAHRQGLLDATRAERDLAELSRGREASRYEELRSDVNAFYVMLDNLAEGMANDPLRDVRWTKWAKELVDRFGMMLDRDNRRAEQKRPANLAAWTPGTQQPPIDVPRDRAAKE